MGTQKHITIVGVGALGSHVAQLLRNEGELKVIDFDRVETKNVASQFHGKTTVGKSKVIALQGTMSLMFGKRVEAVPHKLTEYNAGALLDLCDLVIDCLDNADGRRLIQKHVRRAKLPCLHGALAVGGTFGRAVWDEQFVADEGGAGAAATCEGGEFLPFIGVVSAYVARAAQLYLRENKKIGFQISPVGVVAI